MIFRVANIKSRILKTGPVFFVLSFILIYPLVLHAAHIETKNGQKYEGRWIGEDQFSVFLESDHGLITLSKLEIAKQELEPGETPAPVPVKTIPAGDAQIHDSSQLPDAELQAKLAIASLPPEIHLHPAQKWILEHREQFLKIAEQLKPWIKKYRKNPLCKWALNYANELKAQACMRQMKVLAVQYQAEQQVSAEDASRLEFSECSDEYRFKLFPKAGWVDVWAAPLDPELKMKSFVLDGKSGVIRVEVMKSDEI